MIRLARPLLDAEEEAAVARVLRSGQLVQGAEVAAFEEGLAAVTGRRHAVAVGSGTVALELALEALGVDGGDVLCPALSWPSPAHAILRAGARPVLVDVDPSSWNSTAEAFGAARTDDCRAAIVIDQLGLPSDHSAIAAALGDLPILLDAACSLGSAVDGRPAAAFGRIATTSFHPRKVLTTGEGGACFTDDPRLAERLRVLRNHGQAGRGAFPEAGTNARLTEVAAALGRVQLERLEAMVARRRALAARYRAGLPPRLRCQSGRDGLESNVQTFGVVLPPGTSVDARDRTLDGLRARGVEGGRLSYALSRLPSLRPAAPPPCPVAEDLEDRGLALPMHPGMADDDVDRVVEALGAVAGGPA
ncbi:MAG: DegT/DnrJ/EryC1/StrS family aminotransferase [Sandaracinaceae bacterium]